MLPAPKFAGVITALPAPLTLMYFTCPTTPSAIEYAPAVPFVISLYGNDIDKAPLALTVSCFNISVLFNKIPPVPCPSISISTLVSVPFALTFGLLSVSYTHLTLPTSHLV